MEGTAHSVVARKGCGFSSGGHNGGSTLVDACCIIKIDTIMAARSYYNVLADIPHDFRYYY